MAPHVTEELWERIGREGMCADAAWPGFDAAAAAEPTVTLVVQVNGAVRDRLQVPAGLEETAAVEAALASAKVARALGDGRPSKIVYVPDRILSLVHGRG
jgi:leucyl-tRNA synthetase